MALGLSAIPLAAQSDSAYSLINERVALNRGSFYVYKDHDAGAAKAYPSGLFPSDGKLAIDSACVDDPDSPSGCATDPQQLDCEHGTVFRLTWSPLSLLEFFGLNFEEPENFGTRPRGEGYDLRPGTHLVFRYRSPTGASVRFGINDGQATAAGDAGFATGFISIPASREWREMRIAFEDLIGPSPNLRLNLENVRIPFFVVADAAHAPNGGTLLLDDIRIEPAPARQQTVPSFPLANNTCGVTPAADELDGRVAIPPDQVNRNLTTTYESAEVLWALLKRGTPEDIENARFLADAFVYALSHDNSGFPLPTIAEGRALRNAYIDGDLPFLNDQQCPGSANCPPPEQGSGGKKGEVRLAGFGIKSDLCGESKFCLVLDGATGGNNAFAVISLLAAYRRLDDSRYLDAARSIANWIHFALRDPDPEGFGGYFVGLPDEGKPKQVIRGKSVENNADIAAAFQMLADVESEVCNRAAAETWISRSHIAGDFVMRMFDPMTGRFFAGTVENTAEASPGIRPDGQRRGNEVINTTDFLDANTFVPLAMMGLPRYRDAIDWRRPVDWAARQTQTIQAAGQSFEGFSIVETPVGGPAGIAWEFTGQMVVTMRAVDARYGENRYGQQAAFYLEQIRKAQSAAPFADGRGLVASTLEGGAQIPAYEQCLSTPFQCIAQRVGLAATVWAIFAEQSLNPLGRDAIYFESSPTYVNAASFEGCLAPGGLFTAFQAGAANRSEQAEAFPLPREMAGSRVLFDGAPSALLYGGPAQINGQVGYETAPGAVEAELLPASGGGWRSQVHIAPVAPGLFLDAELRRCIAFNFSGARNTFQTPIEPGSGAAVYLTGCGSVDIPVATGEAALAEPLSRVRAQASATIGGEPAEIDFFGLTPGTAGVAQANLIPRPGLPPGEYEVSIELDGVPSNRCSVFVGGAAAYPAPTISLVSPNHGSPAGGEKITIHGDGFWGSGMQVWFGETPAREIIHIDGSTLIVFAPPGSGSVDISLTAPDNRSATAARAFTYNAPPPSVTAVEPDTGPAGGGTAVKVKGTGFSAGAVLRFGNLAATNVVVRDEQTIEARTPAHDAGAVAVTVTNADGQTGTLPGGFTYSQPAPVKPEITARIESCQVKGTATFDGPRSGYRVVVYVYTDQFYVQPCDTERKHRIAADGTWGPVDSHSGTVYALLVRAAYNAPATALMLPEVDGVDVLAAKGPVGELVSCDVDRCPAQ